MLQAVGDQLVLGGHVDAVDIGVFHRRRGRSDIDLLGAGLAAHLHDLVDRVAAHDGVVDQQDVAVLHFQRDRVQLAAHGFLALFLAGHDEGAAHVAVFHQRFAVADAQ